MVGEKWHRVSSVHWLPVLCFEPVECLPTWSLKSDPRPCVAQKMEVCWGVGSDRDVDKSSRACFGIVESMQVPHCHSSNFLPEGRNNLSGLASGNLVTVAPWRQTTLIAE